MLSQNQFLNSCRTLPTVTLQLWQQLTSGNAGLWTFKKVICFLLLTVLQGLQIFVSHSVETAFLTRGIISLQIVILRVSEILGLVGTFIDTQVHSRVSNRREPPQRSALCCCCSNKSLCYSCSNCFENWSLANFWFVLKSLTSSAEVWYLGFHALWLSIKPSSWNSYE